MTSAANWYRLRADGNAICIFIHAQPNARSTEVAGLHDGRLKIRVAAPALDGRANDRLLEYVRRRLDLPANRVVLAKGQHSRMKCIEITQPDNLLLAAIAAWVPA